MKTSHLAPTTNSVHEIALSPDAMVTHHKHKYFRADHKFCLVIVNRSNFKTVQFPLTAGYTSPILHMNTQGCPKPVATPNTRTLSFFERT